MLERLAALLEEADDLKMYVYRSDPDGPLAAAAAGHIRAATAALEGRRRPPALPPPSVGTTYNIVSVIHRTVRMQDAADQLRRETKTGRVAPLGAHNRIVRARCEIAWARHRV